MTSQQNLTNAFHNHTESPCTVRLEPVEIECPHCGLKAKLGIDAEYVRCQDPKTGKWSEATKL